MSKESPSSRSRPHSSGRNRPARPSRRRLGDLWSAWRLQRIRFRRYFRIFPKKRGNRRTGSEQVGGFAWLAFLVGLLLIGCILLVFILRELVIPDWRLNQAFLPAAGTVQDKGLDHVGNEYPPLYRPWLVIEYRTADGVTHEIRTSAIPASMIGDESAAHDFLGNYRVGQQIEGWYDPVKPRVFVLERGYSWLPWLMLLLPVAFITVGGGGTAYALLQWGKSAERVSALQQKMVAGELFTVESPAGATFPGIPAHADLNNSPGTRLAYRLPVDVSAFWRVLAVSVACVLLFGVSITLVILAIQRAVAGSFDWPLSLFSVLGLAAGAACSYALIRQLWYAGTVGHTIVEIDQHPLRSGGRYRLFFSQGGRLAVEFLRIALVCEERATYRHGTDTRTERRRVYEQDVFLREGFRIRENAPFEICCDLELPPHAMHSFRTACNEVNWSVVVEEEVAGQPSCSRLYTIVVYPESPGMLGI